MKLRGKVALVTGGARRIGRALALELAGRGADVAITYRTSAAEAAATVRAIRRCRVRALAVRADQGRGSEVRQAVAEVEKALGRVDVLINNASSFYPTPWEKATEEEWNDLMAANLSGPWYFSQAVGAGMKRRGAGKIVQIADVAAFSPWTNYLPYCAAKGGLVTLTKGLAKALAPQVQVNAIAPGPILFPSDLTAQERRRAVEKTLLKRAGSARDIVAAALFFIEGSDFVTGVVLPVDGGRLLA